jgi:hypothetical protein
LTSISIPNRKAVIGLTDVAAGQRSARQSLAKMAVAPIDAASVGRPGDVIPSPIRLPLPETHRDTLFREVSRLSDSTVSLVFIHRSSIWLSTCVFPSIDHASGKIREVTGFVTQPKGTLGATKEEGFVGVHRCLGRS